MSAWPLTEEELLAAQRELAAATPPAWRPPPGPLAIGACVVTFPRGKTGAGAAGDAAWAAAAVLQARRGGGADPAGAVRHRWRLLAEATVAGEAGAPYAAGLLARREGPVLEAAVRALAVVPDVLLVDATGRDHPRRAGLALHLGAALDLPTVGVTHRPLNAHGATPGDVRGARSPLFLDGEVVGAWLRTRRGARALAVHAGWRTDVDTAVDVVLDATGRVRTPEPLRHARRLARVRRSAAARTPRTASRRTS